MEGGSPRILLAGATGYIGRQVMHELLQSEYSVTATVRRVDHGLSDCEVVVTDLTDPESLAHSLSRRSFDAVISCIASRTGVAKDAWLVDHQANRNLLDISIKAGAKKFVLLSAICVQRPRLAFQHAKLAFEAELARSGIDYSIVRPTAYFKSLSGQIGRIRKGKPFLMFGDGRLTACKPISERDLARYIADCLVDESRNRKILPIGGPGVAVTPREQGEWLFELMGIRPVFRRVSPKILQYAASLTRPVGKFIPGVTEKSELARIGHYYATESMLWWDSKNKRYDAEATPSFGKDRLYDFYQKALREGLDGQELGAHRLF